jgi:hypothetical protein
MKITKIKIKNYKTGSSLIELVFYIALFAVLSLVVINSMITMTKSFKETSIQVGLMRGADVMERMSREIRRATSINSISSDNLILNTRDGAGVAKTLQFLLSGGNIQLIDNSVLIGNLNTSNTTITALTFSQIVTTEGNAVKVSLTIQSNIDTSRSETFYNTVVLRENY